MSALNLNTTALIIKTTNFAAVKHKNQRRKDPNQTPYINHPIGVANILVEEGGIEDVVLIQSALLHDTVEDTDTTFDELQEHFGSKVANIVKELSDNKLSSKEDRKASQIENAAHKSKEAKIVGMADKIYNLRDLEKNLPVGWDEKRRYEYFIWARKVTQNYYSADDALAQILKDIFNRNIKIGDL